MLKGHQLVIAVLVVLCVFLIYFPPFSPRCAENQAGIVKTPHHPVSKFKVMHTSDDLELYIYSAILDNR